MKIQIEKNEKIEKINNNKPYSEDLTSMLPLVIISNRTLLREPINFAWT